MKQALSLCLSVRPDGLQMLEQTRPTLLLQHTPPPSHQILYQDQIHHAPPHSHTVAHDGRCRSVLKRMREGIHRYGYTCGGPPRCRILLPPALPPTLPPTMSLSPPAPPPSHLTAPPHQGPARIPILYPTTNVAQHTRCYDALSHTRWKRFAPPLAPSHSLSTLLRDYAPLRSAPTPHRSDPSPTPLQVGAFSSSAANTATMRPRPSRRARRRWRLVLARAARFKTLAQIQAAPSPQR